MVLFNHEEIGRSFGREGKPVRVSGFWFLVPMAEILSSCFGVLFSWPYKEVFRNRIGISMNSIIFCYNV